MPITATAQALGADRLLLVVVSDADDVENGEAETGMIVASGKPTDEVQADG
jgi:hypothetical protein